MIRPFLWRLGRVLVHVVVLVACVASIVYVARRRTVDCGWKGRRAACIVEVEDSLGRVRREEVHGVRGAAYRYGPLVGLVTDLDNKGEQALFGTHQIELDDEADAKRLQAFAADQEPETLSLHSGVSHPLRVTILLLLGLLVYSLLTQRGK